MEMYGQEQRGTPQGCIGELRISEHKNGARGLGKTGPSSDGVGLQESQRTDPGDRQGRSDAWTVGRLGGYYWADRGGAVRHLIEDCDRQVARLEQLSELVIELLSQEILGIKSRKTQLQFLLTQLEQSPQCKD